eukprot:CAMPEP_0115831698 /NCGR_PEP_ID=MMETSP0287-20121206/2274_1 /TAXON_ID=412157 /ORGANISM="Chrysochromulina rotalis, Strain UIO044" /LENGTH=484 /DNA_ID=CAMNT_0003285055 /DNA_START=113 /DNA_END=1567 /DNA_ORIENTATION=+
MVRTRRRVKQRRKEAVSQPESWLPHEWKPTSLPSGFVQQLREGVVNVGHLGRLKQAMDRVGHNLPLTIAALGSSVTSDFAGIVGRMQQQFELGYIGLPSRCKQKCVHLGWLLPIFRFLVQNASGSAAKASALVNAGQSARFVDNYADIIFVDGVNGMSPVVGNHVKPTEKLFRRLLSLPHRPAIIVLHWMDWCACVHNCPNTLRINRHRNGTCYTADGFNQSYGVATRREHTVWADLARHYQLSMLSIRGAFHPSARRAALPSQSSRSILSTYMGSLGPSSWTLDGLHPKPCNGAWHRCRYSQLIAAFVNTFLWDILRGYHGHHGDLTPLPLNHLPLFLRALERTVPMERCFGWGVDRRMTPPIGFVNGWQQTSMDTAQTFSPPAYCSEQKPRISKSVTCPKSKPGLTAFTPGSTVVFELPVLASVPGTASARSALADILPSDIQPTEAHAYTWNATIVGSIYLRTKGWAWLSQAASMGVLASQ